jgi:predicted Zn finger-like uncharacterized protein
MILTCPECATGYFVDDAQIRADGRKVRCAACGARWTAYPQPDPAPASAEPQSAIEPPEGAAAAMGDDLPRAYRSRALEEKRMRRAAATGAIWATGAVVLAVALGAAVIFRDAVVRAWPQTASVYATVGLTVNPVGLVIEQVRAEPTLEDGHAVLAVSGVIRNVVDRAVNAPPLRVTLLDAQGKRVAGQIDHLSNARIPAGETRHFLTAIFDPPMSENDLTVDFALGARIPASRQPLTTPAFAAGPTISLRGPGPDVQTAAAAQPATAAPPVTSAVAPEVAAKPLPGGAIGVRD